MNYHLITTKEKEQEIRNGEKVTVEYERQYFEFRADEGKTVWLAVIAYGDGRIIELSPGQSWRMSVDSSEDPLNSPYATKEAAQMDLDLYFGIFQPEKKSIPAEVRKMDPLDTVPDQKYDCANSALLQLGKGLCEDFNMLLPRLTFYAGRPAVEFWYHTVGTPKFEDHTMQLYILVDLETGKLLYVKTFPQTPEYFYNQKQYRAGQSYLHFCEQLLQKEKLTENDIMNSRLRWLYAQPNWMKQWLREQQSEDAWKTAYAPYTDDIRFDADEMRRKRVEKV